MRELLRYIIIFFIGGIVAASTIFSFLKDHEEKRKNEEPGLLWMADTNKKYTDFEPGLVAFLKDTPTPKSSTPSTPMRKQRAISVST